MRLQEWQPLSASASGRDGVVVHWHQRRRTTVEVRRVQLVKARVGEQLGHERPPRERTLEQPHERLQRAVREARRAQSAQVVAQVGVVDDQRRAKGGAEQAPQRIEQQGEYVSEDAGHGALLKCVGARFKSERSRRVAEATALVLKPAKAPG